MRSKYNAKKTLFDGVMYDSKAEAQFASILKIAMKATDVNERVILIERQHVYEIVANGKYIAKYISDFRVTYANGIVKVYDVKGMVTPLYRLKKKLVEAIHGIKIIEVSVKSKIRKG
jgi:hypothetical protein